MTEAEWLVCENPESMSFFASGDEYRRKSRLLACACARRVWHLLGSKHREAIETAERFEEGGATEDELTHLCKEIEELNYREYRGDHATDLPRQAVEYAVHAESPFPFFEKFAAGFAWDAEGPEMDWNEACVRETAGQIVLVREIFGNPFRPVTLNPLWLTFDVQALAQGIYEERAFDRMPILADALQDAGCDNPDVLNHCRDANQVHVRGCWVLDLLLGKA